MTLSVASGWGFDEMESLLPGTPHWSVIPNTPIAVGEGIVIAEERHSLSAEQYAQVHGLLSSVALVEVLGPKPTFWPIFKEQLCRRTFLSCSARAHTWCQEIHRDRGQLLQLFGK